MPLPAATAAAPPADRPTGWAQPLVLEGVPNLHRVSADLYRSAQPSGGGMRRLRSLGIETVVNLRSFPSDGAEIAGTGLGYEQIFMKAWHPEEEEVVRFLEERSFYALSLSGVGAFGAITPLGGIAWVIGWVCLVRASRSRGEQR